MALFTDGLVSSMEDLTSQDSQLLNIASVEGIDVTQKLAAAQEQIGLEIDTMLNQLRGARDWLGWAPQPDLGRVAVTPPLRLWHTYRTLELVYTDAFHSQLNDRYGGKRDQFHELGEWAREKLVQVGIGVVPAPIRRAIAPSVVVVPGDLPDGTYFVTMTWTNAAGEEGAPATPLAVTTLNGTLLVRADAAPQNATGWNVYAGTDPGALQLQNETAIATGANWLQPGTVTTGGRVPGYGQAPKYLRPVPRMIQRG